MCSPSQTSIIHIHLQYIHHFTIHLGFSIHIHIHNVHHLPIHLTYPSFAYPSFYLPTVHTTSSHPSCMCIICTHPLTSQGVCIQSKSSKKRCHSHQVISGATHPPRELLPLLLLFVLDTGNTVYHGNTL